MQSIFKKFVADGIDGYSTTSSTIVCTTKDTHDRTRGKLNENENIEKCLLSLSNEHFSDQSYLF